MKVSLSQKSNSIKNVDNNKIALFDAFLCVQEGFKCFIGYKNDKLVKPLCIMVTKMMSGYVSISEKDKCMCFLSKVNNCLRNTIKVRTKSATL